MTRLILLPDEDTVTVLEAAESPEELAAAVNTGKWKPPEPYGMLLKDLEDARELSLRALVFGGAVVVAPHPEDRLREKTAVQQAPKLSRRQREVLQGLADGMTTAQIAYRLGITTRTVAAHIGHLKQILGVVSRAQIVGVASVLGLLDASPGGMEVMDQEGN